MSCHSHRWAAVAPAIGALLLAVSALPTSAGAPPTDAERSVSIRVRHQELEPSESPGGKLTGGVTSVRLGMRVATSPRVYLEAEIVGVSAGLELTPPVSSDASVENETFSALGNPYAGVSVAMERPRQRARLGLFVPVAPKHGSNDDLLAVLLGATSEFTRELESYTGNHLPLLAEVQDSIVGDGSVRIDLRVGARLWVPIEEGFDAEMFVCYAAAVAVPVGTWHAGVSLDGRADISADSNQETFYHDVWARLDGHIGRVRPRLEWGVPLTDDLRDSVSWRLQFAVTLDLD